MPIRRDLRHFYRGPAWEATRTRILARAKNKCEQCGKPNHRRVWVVSAIALWFAGAVEFNRLDNHFPTSQFWSPVKGDGQKWRTCTDAGSISPLKLRGNLWKLPRMIRVVLTVAHLNHAAGDDRDENLKALCQWCHLNYDRVHHTETRRGRKDAARPLLQEDACNS